MQFADGVAAPVPEGMALDTVHPGFKVARISCSFDN